MCLHLLRGDLGEKPKSSEVTGTSQDGHLHVWKTPNWNVTAAAEVILPFILKSHSLPCLFVLWCQLKCLRTPRISTEMREISDREVVFMEKWDFAQRFN